MEKALSTLAYHSPTTLARRPRYVLPVFLLTALLTSPLIPVGRYVLMGLVFDALPSMNVDNAQGLVVAVPLLLVTANGAMVARLLVTRRRGLIVATASLGVALLALALAVFLWVPAFRA